MAKKKKYYKRDYLKQHYATKTFISNDGLHVERDFFNKEKNQLETYNPSIHEDKYGRRFIRFNSYGDIFIAEMVISCYCAPKPKDGKQYEIEHIDGNLSNDHRNNLRWVEVTSEYLAQKEIMLKNILITKRMKWYKDRKIKVLKDGTITQNKERRNPFAYIDCRDMDWFYNTTNPKIHYSETNSYGRTVWDELSVDTVMADFGFVKGDKESLQHPVILHVNNDYMDFTPGNLEWCENTDPRYTQYQKVAHDTAMKKDREDNHKWLSPRSWVSVYSENEPYQDWSEKKGRPENARYEEYWTPERVQEAIKEIWPTESLNNNEKSKENEA